MLDYEIQLHSQGVQRVHGSQNTHSVLAYVETLKKTEPSGHTEKKYGS